MERGCVALNGSLSSRLAATFAVLALALAGCTSTPEPEEEPADTGSEFKEAPAPPPRPEPKAEPVRRTSVDLETIYFDFDRYDIRADARPVLRANAGEISDFDGRVTIEGHCDERGSEEYNLALGERRANATKRYLVDLGVPASRLRTVSYGESRPAVQGHDESAWRYNRRAQFQSGR